jgi:hypothetical protein
MRQKLLGVAEVCGWIAVSFTVFLALRVLSILLNLVDLGQCTDSCDAGPQVLPIALFTFGLAWCPVVLVSLVRAVKRGSESWWAPHTLAVVVAHALAMVILVRIFSQFPDADTRTEILAACAASFDVVTGFLVLVAPRRNVAI